MKNNTNKTVSIPTYLAEQLEDISQVTGYSQSAIAMKALEKEIHLYRQDGTSENTIYFIGRTSGWASEGSNLGKCKEV